MLERQKAELKRIHCVCRTCVADIAYSANCAQRFFLFSYLDFRFHFACYPPESFKTICFTCIWSKFIDTIFHLHKARNKSLPHRHGGVRGRVHFSPPGAKLYFHVNTPRKILLYWPLTHHQHGRLVTWLQATNCVKQKRIIIIITDRGLELAT